MTLSSRQGDAVAAAGAVNARGQAAVVYTEWHGHREVLRIATRAGRSWRTVTLDSQPEPIWSPRVVITPNSTTLATWIVQSDPIRTIRAAVLSPGGTWRRPVTIESGDGLWAVALSAGRGDFVVCAWHDAVAGETRIRLATYGGHGWSPVSTLASSMQNLDHVTFVGRDAALVRWRLEDRRGSHFQRFAARLRGSRWIDLPAAEVDGNADHDVRD
jgi:hypothetical protein